jgi:hypothetical protein
MTTVLTQAGEEAIIDKLDVATKFEYIDWGTDANGASKDDTAITTPAGESRVLGTVTQPAADKYQVVGTMTKASSGATITNAGLFNASSTGVMLMKGDFTGIVLNVGDKIEFTFLLEIT